jgi:ureidoglycolate dehydrogenase (NAD+)
MASEPQSIRRLPHTRIEAWARDCLAAVGVNAHDAATVASALVQTNLWGIDSHGVARLTHYVSRIQAGSIKPNPSISSTRTGPCTAQLHGDHGLGIVVCFAATKLAISMAQENGAGIVGIAESSHCGAIGLYTREMARAGLIGVAFTHASSVVAPHGGKQKYLGTNPLSIAFPRAGHEPVCLDMATSSIPFNRVMNARRENKLLPPDVAIDGDGNYTRDPHATAAVLPLGGEAYGHKGYALALMIELLCGPLNGMPYANHITPMFEELTQQRRLGSLVMAIDPRRFLGGSTLAQTVDTFVREAQQQPGNVKYPSEPEYLCEQERRRDGIPLEPGLLAEMNACAERLGIAAPGAAI